MTVNEVNQAIRNLMVSQPMVTSGPFGAMISNALNMIDNFRAFSMSITAYPMQDSLKFGMTAELSRLDNSLSMLIVQNFQEKGLNLFGMMQMAQPNMMQPQTPYMGQPQGMMNGMGYGSNMQRFNQPQMNGMQQYAMNNQYAPQNAMFNQMSGGMQNVSMQGQVNGGVQQMPNLSQTKTGGASLRGIQKTMPIRPMQAPRQPRPFSYGNSGFNAKNLNGQSVGVQPSEIQEPEKNEFTKVEKPKDVVIPTPVAQPTNAVKNSKPSKKPAAAFLESQNISTSATESIEDGDDGEVVPPSNAAGRDYLLQLLKK